jgi:hypothetical protein
VFRNAPDIRETIEILLPIIFSIAIPDSHRFLILTVIELDLV